MRIDIIKRKVSKNLKKFNRCKSQLNIICKEQWSLRRKTTGIPSTILHQVKASIQRP